VGAAAGDPRLAAVGPAGGRDLLTQAVHLAQEDERLVAEVPGLVLDVRLCELRPAVRLTDELKSFGLLNIYGLNLALPAGKTCPAQPASWEARSSEHARRHVEGSTSFAPRLGVATSSAVSRLRDKAFR
jgi:hypothetical protein